MDEELQPQIEETPEVDISLSGLDLLRSAFGTPEAMDDTEEVTGEVETPVTDGVPKAPAEPSLEDYSRVLQDPRVVTALREANINSIQQARALWENELAMQRAREEEALLSDEEIGERVRQQRVMQPVLTQAQQAGYARAQQDLIRFGIGDIFVKVPELSNLSSEERERYNPTSPQYSSMGEYISALVDAAANKRAEKLAESKAKSMAKALAKDEVAKIRKNQPSLAGVTGRGSPVDKMVDVERMSGIELLRKGFS